MRTGRPVVDALRGRSEASKREVAKVVAAMMVVGVVAAVVWVAGGTLLRAIAGRRRSRYYYWTTSPSKSIRSNGSVVIPSEPSELTGHSLRSRSR